MCRTWEWNAPDPTGNQVKPKPDWTINYSEDCIPDIWKKDLHYTQLIRDEARAREAYHWKKGRINNEWMSNTHHKQANHYWYDLAEDYVEKHKDSHDRSVKTQLERSSINGNFEFVNYAWVATILNNKKSDEDKANLIIQLKTAYYLGADLKAIGYAHSSGPIGSAAWKFGDDMMTKHGGGYGNAGRHMYWMMRLACVFGPWQATIIGIAHEAYESPTDLDSAADKINNALALGYIMSNPCLCEDKDKMKKEIEKLLTGGTAVIDKDKDQRVKDLVDFNSNKK